MMGKIYDIAVKTGEYQNNQGETKGRYENVGAVMKGQDGSSFIIMKRTFNPAGVPNPENRDTVILSLFQPRDSQQHQPAQQYQQPPAQQPPQQSGGGYDADIPF